MPMHGGGAMVLYLGFYLHGYGRNTLSYDEYCSWSCVAQLLRNRTLHNCCVAQLLRG